MNTSYRKIDIWLTLPLSMWKYNRVSDLYPSIANSPEVLMSGEPNLSIITIRPGRLIFIILIINTHICCVINLRFFLLKLTQDRMNRLRGIRYNFLSLNRYEMARYQMYGSCLVVFPRGKWSFLCGGQFRLHMIFIYCPHLQGMCRHRVPHLSTARSRNLGTFIIPTLWFISYMQ